MGLKLDILVDEVENLLWDNGIEYNLVEDREDVSIKILGLSEEIYIRPVWPDEQGNLILDSDDLNVYVSDEFFGQLSSTTPEQVVDDLDPILNNFR